MERDELEEIYQKVRDRAISGTSVMPDGRELPEPSDHISAFEFGRAVERTRLREKHRIEIMAVFFWGFVSGLVLAALMTMLVDRPPL